MDKILVVDFGSQFNQVIVKSLRSIGVASDLVPYFDAYNALKNNNYKGIILSGGPTSVFEKDSYKIEKEIIDFGLPILGICYGMQYLVHNSSGKVMRMDKQEYGKCSVKILKSTKLTEELHNNFTVWMSHSDSVVELGDEYIECAVSENGQTAIVKHKDKEIYGVQFHLEVTHTNNGIMILENFAIDICGASRDWSLEKYFEKIQKDLKETIKDDKVLCAISGGVDSTVVGVLLNSVLKDNIIYVFVDTGLLRENEGDEVLKILQNSGIDVMKVDASEKMFNSLKGLTDPEEKRKMIGKVFIEVFHETLKNIKKENNVKYLAQGTLYSDVIESGTATSKTIKSHHNVGGLPKELGFELIEPIRHLFKDEVRKLGLMLGVDESMVYRQPFPGPGLGIRVIGEVTPEKVEIARKADTIVRNTIKKYNLEKEIWQYFAVLTDTFSVGVKGDNRAYERVVAIRAIESQDFMTANISRIDYEILEEMSSNICNSIRGVSRVVYDVTSKPPGTVEWE